MVDYLSDHVLRGDSDTLTVTPLYTSDEAESREDDLLYTRAPASTLARVVFEGSLTKASLGAAVAYAEILLGLKDLAETVLMRSSLGTYFVDLEEVYVRLTESTYEVRFGVVLSVVGTTLTHTRGYALDDADEVTSSWGI